MLVHTGRNSPVIIVGQFCKIDRAILQNCTTENPEELPSDRYREFRFPIQAAYII